MSLNKIVLTEDIMSETINRNNNEIKNKFQ